jgi:phage tail sheath protein FI
VSLERRTRLFLGELQQFCRDRRAFLIADSKQNAKFDDLVTGPNSKITGDPAINAAFYFPWLLAPDPLQENRPRELPPCGYVAGLYARTDANRGVWKAPAGTEASLVGVLGPKLELTNDENGVLNPQAVNCIRTLPVYGTVLWGARTLQGNDERGSEWKYIPVRRTALFIEETLFRALKWVVFEPNDEPLWAQIRLNIGAFMHDLFRQGAFQGKTPKDAYFVKCDNETTTQTTSTAGSSTSWWARAAEARRSSSISRSSRCRSRSRPCPGDHSMAQFSVNAQRLRSLQELQFSA